MTGPVQNLFPSSHVRLDGGLTTRDGDLYLALLPLSGAVKKGRTELELSYPDEKQPELVLYNNGMGFIKLHKKGDASYIHLPGDLPDKVKKRLFTYRLAPDLIVPEGFVLPKSLRGLAQELSVSVADDAVVLSPEFGKKQAKKTRYSGKGVIFLTSVSAGTITIIDTEKLTKVAEFPTEGTPCSMDYVDGKLYIADQTKNRILILDPDLHRFIGQIDLPPGSAPKGLAAAPSGQWLYVSESGTGNVSVIETAKQKVLVKTRVGAGPGRMMITPDGLYLLVLCSTAGDLTVMSMYNQKVVSNIKVGAMPVAVTVSSDSKHAYVSNRMANSVTVIDLSTRSVAGTIATPNGPGGLLLSPDNLTLYVACGRENKVAVYDTRSLAKLHDIEMTAPIEFPGWLCYLPGRKKILVVSQQSDAFGVIDTDTMTLKVVPGPGHPSHESHFQPIP